MMKKGWKKTLRYKIMGELKNNIRAKNMNMSISMMMNPRVIYLFHGQKKQLET